MKTCAPTVLAGIVTALWVAGCQPDDPVTTQIGGAGTAPGAGGASGGGQNTGGGGGQGGTIQPAGEACGGRQVLPCHFEKYCHFPAEDQCGKAGTPGFCARRPAVCEQDCPGACACDGQLYCNACMAHADGVNVTPAQDACVQATGCEGATHAIANLAASGGTCTSVVRLDYQTREIKSVRILCAPAASVISSRARERAEVDTGFGADAQQISDLAPKDEYVFWEPPVDHGGVAAVSARTGMTVFGGSIVMNEKGGVVYPVSFLSPATMGMGCGSSEPMPPARGLDLEIIEDLPAADVDAALSVVWGTALPDALAIGSNLLDAMVLRYPGQVGGFDPAAAEWVVLLNSGPIQ